ncbi:MAG: exosortase K [Flavobacterium sp.]|nr:exosortase K [Flavobacterium sp.]
MKRIKSQHYYYAAIIGIFLLLKQYYTATSNNDLKFLLTPTNALVSLLFGSSPQYSTSFGYVYDNLNIVIEKSCSGYNFWILCFAMLAFLTVNSYKTHLKKIAAILLILTISWLLTIFVNTSRIATAIFISEQFPNSSKQFPWLHQSEGIFIYLSFLIAFYMILNRLLTKFKTTNA